MLVGVSPLGGSSLVSIIICASTATNSWLLVASACIAAVCAFIAAISSLCCCERCCSTFAWSCTCCSVASNGCANRFACCWLRLPNIVALSLLVGVVSHKAPNVGNLVQYPLAPL